MSLHPPRYSLPPPALRPHSARVGVVVSAAFQERVGAMNIVLLAFIFTVVLLQVILPFYFATLVPGAGGPALSMLYLPFASQVWFFFQVLFTASIGAGIIANDVSTRAITMYLSRPITHLDYLGAKGLAIGAWLSIAIVLPGVIGTIIVLGLGYVSLPLALEGAAGFLAVGLLTTLSFTGLALLLSAWAPKSSYAAASIFGVLAGAEIVSLVVAGISGEQNLLYFSVEQDVLATAQAAFGVSGGALDPWWAGAILVAIGVVTIALTYQRLSTIDAVAE